MAAPYPYAFSESPREQKFPWLEWGLFGVIVGALLWPSTPADDPRYTFPLFGGVEARVFGEYRYVETNDGSTRLFQGQLSAQVGGIKAGPKILVINRTGVIQAIYVTGLSDNTTAISGMIILPPGEKAWLQVRAATPDATTWTTSLRMMEPSER